MKTVQHIGVKLDAEHKNILDELQGMLQAKSPISKVSRTDTIKFAIRTLYEVENKKKGFNQSVQQRYGVK